MGFVDIPGHPRLASIRCKDVDARHEAGHGDGEGWA